MPAAHAGSVPAPRVERAPDPGLLSAHPNLRENTAAVGLDKGVWPTLRRRRAGLTVADPRAGQVAYAGVFDNRQGGLTPLFVRLKIGGGRVEESEVAYGVGPGDLFHPEALLEPDILYDAPVPPARRSARPTLIEVANRYMDGIGARSGANVPIAARCDKYFLGGRVTNSPVTGIGSCEQSFATVRSDPPAGRRVLIVDAERGLVVVSFLLPHPKGGAPGATYTCEILKIVDGKIRSVDEFGADISSTPSSGFEG